MDDTRPAWMRNLPDSATEDDGPSANRLIEPFWDDHTEESESWIKAARRARWKWMTENPW